MIEMNRHTFVICAYRESRYLEECIRSVMDQTVESDRIIVTSTPNEYIAAMARKYGLEVRAAHHISDIARDWNYALSVADTPYVTIAHQDDIYDRHYVANVIRALDSDREALICATDYYEIRDGERVSRNVNLYVKRMLSLPLMVRALRRTWIGKRMPIALGNGICCPSVTYNMTHISLPLFEEGMKSNIDWLAWERLSRETGSFLYIHKLLMGHRIHEESTTTEIIEDHSRGQEDYEMLRRFWPPGLARMICKLYSSSEKSNEV